VIAGLEGVVARKGIDYAVVNVGGVHYKVQVSTETLAALGAEGARVTVSTYLYVREDALQLFGFRSDDEEQLFEQLLNVSGIGPKSALALVGTMGAAGLQQAITAGNVDVLKRVPGIGVKTAQRLILELRGKLVGGVGPAPPAGSPEADLAEALSGLGYTPAEVSAATEYLKGVDLPLEERLRRALRYFADHA
jgi:Holliday junction DNA helicase RuvA